MRLLGITVTVGGTRLQHIIDRCIACCSSTIVARSPISVRLATVSVAVIIHSTGFRQAVRVVLLLIVVPVGVVLY
jgi:hypothetical protein